MIFILHPNSSLYSAAEEKADAKHATAKPTKEDAKIEGAALIGIDVRKDLDFPTWYQQVLTKGDMVALHSYKTNFSLIITMYLGVTS
jgi:prolyl-tRNA synthetase